MHARLFQSVPEGTSQLSCTYKRLVNYWEKMCISGWEMGWLVKIFVQFLGKVVDFCPDLHKFSVEQPSWEGLHNFLGEACSVELCNSGAE